MKTKIHHITQIKGNNKVKHQIYYESGRIASFTEKENLPKSAVFFLINSKRAETRATTTGTITRFY